MEKLLRILFNTNWPILSHIINSITRDLLRSCYNNRWLACANPPEGACGLVKAVKAKAEGECNAIPAYPLAMAMR